MEIKIDDSLKENISEFFIQTLALLFFPEDNTFGKSKSGNFININKTKNIKSIEIIIEICYNDKRAEKKRVMSVADNKDLKLEIGRVFYNTAIDITGIEPPWGIHTGIRPAKVAGDILENNNDDIALDILLKKYLISENKARLAIETYKNGRNALVKANCVSLQKQILHEIKFAGGRMPPLQNRDFSLYISIPFCPTRCRYCSFVSYSTQKLLRLIPEYIKKLVHELEIIGEITRELGLMLKSVYIGGGTPAVLSAGELEIILQAVRNNFDFKNILEYTVECGRADVITREKFEVLIENGVDRISVNPQTFNDDVLAKNGRNHTAEDFFRAYELARDMGFKNINADCIAGLPGESCASMINTVERLAELKPENITIHTLCIKKSAELKKIAEYTPDSPELNQVLENSYKILKDAGYNPYYLYRQKYSAGNLENTGFSLSGRECLYNIYMMDEIQTIFGAGAGAMTKLVRVDRDSSRIERIANYKYPFEYIEHDFQIERESNRNKLEILED